MRVWGHGPHNWKGIGNAAQGEAAFEAQHVGMYLELKSGRTCCAKKTIHLAVAASPARVCRMATARTIPRTGTMTTMECWMATTQSEVH